MKVTLFVLFFVVAIAVAVDTVPVEEYDTVEVEWPKFKKNFDKTYNSPEEETKRLAIFTETLKTIKEHNKKYKNGDELFTMGINQFADLTPAEVTLGKLPLPEANNQNQNADEQVPNLHGLVGH